MKLQMKASTMNRKEYRCWKRQNGCTFSQLRQHFASFASFADDIPNAQIRRQRGCR